MSEPESPSAPEPEFDPPEKKDDSAEVSPDSISPTIPGGRNPELDGLDPRELIEGGLQSRTNPATWEPPTPEELHRLLPQYEIDALIGRGGMGAVYRGRQATLDRLVAIKLLPAEMASDEEFVARFKREARTLAKLHHPGIVLVHDFGQTSEGHLYFVMEFVDGTDLYKIIHGPGLDCAQALEIVGQICDALQYAHSEGVVHRDIKPANVILGLDGRAKLADFGLARPTDDGSGVFTRTNVVMGTPDYMAPEALAGESDHRADLYSLGVMLYEMLTGKPPRGAWATPSERVQVDVRLDEVVVRAMQEDPELRYQQASEIGTDVEAIRTTPLQGVAKAKPKKKPKAVEKEGDAPKPETKSKTPWLVGVAIALGLGAFLFPWDKMGSESSDDPVAGGDAPEVQPLPEVLAARERGGKLRVFGKHKGGLAELGGTAEFTDFQTVVVGDHGWAARRKEGATFSRSNEESRRRSGEIPLEFGPFQTDFLQRSAYFPLVKTAKDGDLGMVYGAKGMSYYPGNPDIVAFVRANNHFVGLAKEGDFLIRRTFYKDLHDPPVDFFLRATAYSGVAVHYISARPNLPVRAFNIKTGDLTDFPSKIRDIVEMDSNPSSVILLTSGGQVFVTTPEGTPLATVPPDLGPAIAVRAGRGMFAAQMTDGTWRAWGDSLVLTAQTARIGHAIDIDFISEYGFTYMMWIEPVEADAPDMTEVTPDPEVLAAREQGGRLRSFGYSPRGSLEVGKAAEFSDFQSLVLNHECWAARRKSGDTYAMVDLEKKDTAEPPTELGPYHTNFLQRGRTPVMQMTSDGSYRNIHGGASQHREEWANHSAVAFLNPDNHILSLDKEGVILRSEHWNGGGRKNPVPSRAFFLNAAAYTTVKGHYISARPGNPVRSFDVAGDKTIDFPSSISNIVEMDSNSEQAILRDAFGNVHVVTSDGQPYGTIPDDATPSVAVRAGSGMFASQRPDGTWRVWGESDLLVAKVKEIGHAIDIDFHTAYEGARAYMMWIEPVEEENPDGPESDRQHTGPLGHTYVPVDGLANVLFSTWETRVKDFEAFVKETGHDMSGLVNANSSLSWQNPGFEQTGDHPVVLVNRGDANAYCRWLTEKERAAGRLLPGQVYRLPTDREWSAAMGVLDEKGDFPSEREFPDNVFTWPRGTPPPHNAENIRWANDDFQHTAPVGSGIANQFGIYDLLGNVMEICADPWSINPMSPAVVVVRGSAYDSGPKVSRFNVRGAQGEVRVGSPTQGFRCILDLKNEKQRAIQMQMEKAVSSLHELSILQNKPSREISSLVTDEFVLLDLSQWNHLNQEESKRLEGLPLTHLMFITGDPNGDLGFMKTLPLEVVLLKMEPHANFEKLTANLAGLPLTHATLSHHPDLPGGVESLDFLRGASLRHLHLQNFRNLRDMDALRGMPLEILHLRYSAIPDLSPLRDAPMKSISLEPKVPSLEEFLDGLEWWDQNVFANVPIELIASRSLGEASTGSGRSNVVKLVAETETRMKAIPYLQTQEASDSIIPVLEEQLRFATSVANWLEGEVGSFANDIRTHGNHTYLLTPWVLDFDSASEFARALGAHLVTVTTPEENAFVSQMLDDVDTQVQAWLGLVQKGKGREGWEWETGEPLAIHNWATEMSGMTEAGTSDVARLGVGETEIGRPWKHWSRSSGVRVLLEWDTPTPQPPARN